MSQPHVLSHRLVLAWLSFAQLGCAAPASTPQVPHNENERVEDDMDKGRSLSVPEHPHKKWQKWPGGPASTVDGESWSFDQEHSSSAQQPVPWLLAAASCALVLLSGMLICISLRKELEKMCSVSRQVVVFVIISLLARMIDYTIIIPTVYDTVKTAGGSEAFSGAVIGAFFATSFIGVISLHSPVLEGISFRRITICFLMVYPLSSAGYFGSSLAQGRVRLGVMLGARCLSGIAEGALSTLHHAMLARVSPPATIVNVCLVYTMTEMFGYAFGPMLSSVCVQASEIMSVPIEPVMAPVAAMCFLHVLMFLFAVHWLPGPEDLEKVETCVSCEREVEQGTATTLQTKRRIISTVILIAVTSLAYYMSASLESATALILETDYGLPPTLNGYIISIIFGAFVPVGFVFTHVFGHLSNAMTGAFTFIITFLLQLLLLPAVCTLVGLQRIWIGKGCLILIMVADLGVCTSLTLARGIGEGLAYERCGEHSNRISAALVCFSSIASLIASPFTRYLISHGGITWYAYSALAASGCGFLLFVAQEFIFRADWFETKSQQSFETELAAICGKEAEYACDEIAEIIEV